MPRYETGYFSINDKGYLGVGVNVNNLYNDFWEYTGDPLSVANEGFQNDLQFTICPNIASEYIVVNSQCIYNKSIYIFIRDANGKTIFEQSVQNPVGMLKTKIDVSRFLKGIYFVEITNGKEIKALKFLKE